MKNKTNLIGVKLSVLSGVLALTFISCSPKVNSVRNQVWNNKAPQSSNETGMIVQGVSHDQLQNFLNKTGLSARVLHKETGLYEVFSRDAELVKNALPEAHVVPNKFYSNLFIDSENPVARLQSKIKLLDETTEAADGNKDPKKCNRNPATGPSPKIDNKKEDGLDEIVQNGTIELTGHPLAFTAMNSLRAPEGSQYLWQVVAPEGSDVLGEIQKAQEISFTPDMPGAYIVALLVIDNDNNCNLAQTLFAITVNPEKKEAVEPREFTSEDEEKFHHLGMINAEQAWAISKGEGVKIAVIDTGVNYNHPDLSSNIFINENEIPGNGIDDDGNGFIDDTNGWDFVNGDNSPFDDQSHGTHVSGLAASGVFGVAPLAQVIPIKALSAFGSGDIASIDAAIRYAVDSGADIINMSLGGLDPEFAEGLKQSMAYAEEKGVIVMAAAGNGHPLFGIPMDNDKTPVYPANMGNSNIIVVAATDKNKTLTEYSNFGKTTVNIAAPGGSRREGDLALSSSYYWPVEGKDNMYIAYCGTSMATPVSAGAVAVLKSLDRSLTAKDLKKVFNVTSQKSEALKGKLVSEGVVDVLSAAAYVTYSEVLGGVSPDRLSSETIR